MAVQLEVLVIGLIERLESPFPGLVRERSERDRPVGIRRWVPGRGPRPPTPDGGQGIQHALLGISLVADDALCVLHEGRALGDDGSEQPLMRGQGRGRQTLRVSLVHL